MKDKEYFKDRTESLLENHGFNALQECINGIEDTSIQKTFITFLNAAKEGDKEAEELLIDHFAGWMENRQRQIMF